MHKIVHLTTVHNPHDTRILYRECVSLANNKFSVTLLACSNSPPEVENIHVINFPVPQSRLKRMTLTAFQFINVARKLDAQIYHFHDPELAPWMMLLKLITGKPVIFDVHENIIGSLSDRKWIPDLFKPFIFAATKTALPLLMRSFKIIFAEKSYPNVYPWIKDYKIIYNFPSLAHFPKETSEKFDVFSLVYVGSITKERGLLDMLDALKLLQQQGRKVDLYLAGKPHLKNQQTLKNLIAERNLDNVHFLGYVPQPEALKLISRCHLGLAILHPVKNYVSSYPTKIFEYMGCGLPFITSDFPLYKEVTDKWHCGLTVTPQNVTQLAQVVGDCMDGRQDLANMGRMGKQAVSEEYNWHNEEKALLSLYQELTH